MDTEDTPYIHPAVLARIEAEQAAGRERLAVIQRDLLDVAEAAAQPLTDENSSDPQGLEGVQQPLTDEQIAAAEELIRRAAAPANHSVGLDLTGLITGVSAPAPEPAPEPAPVRGRRSAPAPEPTPAPEPEADPASLL